MTSMAWGTWLGRTQGPRSRATAADTAAARRPAPCTRQRSRTHAICAAEEPIGEQAQVQHGRGAAQLDADDHDEHGAADEARTGDVGRGPAIVRLGARLARGAPVSEATRAARRSAADDAGAAARRPAQPPARLQRSRGQAGATARRAGWPRAAPGGGAPALRGWFPNPPLAPSCSRRRRAAPPAGPSHGANTYTAGERPAP